MRRLALAIAVVGLVVVAGFFVMTGRTSASPEQPLPFSHKNHAVDRQIACEYCHRGASEGWTAYIPPVETCMGCHSSVGGDKPGVQKLRAEYWDKQQPIQWAQLWFVPQHAKFSHAPHAQAVRSCTDCHAQGNAPERWFQPFRPSMSWCVTCHAGRGGGTDCWTCHT